MDATTVFTECKDITSYTTAITAYLLVEEFYLNENDNILILKLLNFIMIQMQLDLYQMYYQHLDFLMLKIFL